MAQRLPSLEEIKTELLENWEQFVDAKYPEDLLTEYAQGWLPVYYGDIISCWSNDLTNEDSNRFMEIRGELTPEVTIYDLMLDDLYLFLNNAFSVAYAEILEEKEEVA
jgi:hypothetical protein